jgi:hypothetical protein
MVGVAQLVEHLVVVQDVAGSSPVTHPKVTGRPSWTEWPFYRSVQQRSTAVGHSRLSPSFFSPARVASLETSV